MDFILEQYATDNPDKLKFHRAVDRVTVEDKKSWTRVLHGEGLRKWLGKLTPLNVIEQIAKKSQRAAEQQAAVAEQLKEPKQIVQTKPSQSRRQKRNL